MIMKEKITNEEKRGKIKEKGYIISFYSILNILIKKRIYKCIILIVTIFIICLLFYKYNNKPFNGRIFVTSMYNNEAEMAYIHIWRLYNYIDKFIIVASNITHSNIPKIVSFSPFERNIQPYMKKIDIINFNNICNKKEYPSDNLAWCLEKSQRDYAKTFIEEKYNPTENDLIIIVDLDEILTRKGIKYIKKNPPENYYFIKGSLYFPYYYHKLEDWNLGCVIRYNKNMTTFSKIRRMPKENHILKYKINPSRPLITHCSFCFKKLEQYKNKIISFSAIEFNKPKYRNNNWIFKSHYCRTKIRSPQGYDEPYEGWRNLIPNDPRLKYLIDPSFMYPLNLTTYTEEDLEKMCDRKYRRTPFNLFF